MPIAPYARFDPQPLLSRLYSLIGCPVSDWEAAEIFGVDRQKIRGWRRDGVTYTVADRICCAVLDTHPLLLWPDFYDDIDTSEDAA